MKLGLVTYNIAADWPLETLLERTKAAGLSGVELRTTHAHGVEPALDADARAAVRRKVEASGVELVGLGTTCEFHAADPDVVKGQIETGRAFIDLAHDVGAAGVKVRPNGFTPGVPRETTLAQIANALQQLGEVAQTRGVEVWLEIHGRGTCEIEPMRRVMELCDHPAVGLCWNSNPQDVKDGSIRDSFARVEPWIRHVHINELHSEYPWAQLFAELRRIDYNGYCMAEIPASPDAERLLRYYRALWEQLAKGA